jgi:hypothetical protein
MRETMKRWLTIVVLALLCIVAYRWIYMRAFSPVPRNRYVAACKDHPCGTPDLEVRLESPDEDTVCENAFWLIGEIGSPNRDLTIANLTIVGRYPSSLPRWQTSLLDGELGAVVPPRGGPFRILVRGRLFQERIQLYPYNNIIALTAQNDPAIPAVTATANVRYMPTDWCRIRREQTL